MNSRRCEDFPCCGHELGCCPDYDGSGRQLNMICVCGTVLPIGNRFSICDGCLNDSGDDADEGRYDDRHNYADDDSGYDHDHLDIYHEV